MRYQRRLPTEPESIHMLGIEAFAWPVTYTYFIDAPFGETQQSITVNAPQLEGNTEATKRLGPLIWSLLTAPAVVGDVRMYVSWSQVWRGGSLPQPYAGVEGRGSLIALASNRDNTPQALMMTGHDDNAGRRRLFFPGAPRGWSSAGLLTTSGWENLLAHCNGCMLGLATPDLLSGLEWLNAYPNVLEATMGNPRGIAFRRVTHLAVCHHTDKAPGPSGLPD